MRFEDEEIGGLDLGSYILYSQGDPVIARSHLYEAQVMLGNLKHSMQFQGNQQGQVFNEFPDGSKVTIRVCKGDGVTQDVSTIFIDATNATVVEEVSEGTTIEGFVATIRGKTTNNNPFMGADITFPIEDRALAYINGSFFYDSGGSINLTRSYSGGTSFLTSVTGFPDFDAKWISGEGIGDFRVIYAGAWLDTSDSTYKYYTPWRWYSNNGGINVDYFLHSAYLHPTQISMVYGSGIDWDTFTKDVLMDVDTFENGGTSFIVIPLDVNNRFSYSSTLKSRTGFESANVGGLSFVDSFYVPITPSTEGYYLVSCTINDPVGATLSDDNYLDLRVHITNFGVKKITFNIPLADCTYFPGSRDYVWNSTIKIRIGDTVSNPNIIDYIEVI